MPKVLINALSAQQGGGQTYLLNLIRGTKTLENIQFYLIVSAQNEHVFSNLPQTTLIRSNFAGKSLIHRLLWENFHLPFLLRKLQVQIFLAPAGILPKFFLPQSCTYVTVCQNMLPFSPRELARSPSLLFRLKFRILYHSQLYSFRYSDLVIFISQFARDTIVPLLKKDSIQTVVIPHGLPLEFRDETKRPSPFNFEYILYVSSFFEYKAQLEVIDAWLSLMKKRPTKEKLVLLGYDRTPYGNRVREKIRELNQSNNIIMLSSVAYESLPAYYQNAKALIFASSCENCPNILLESLASGSPVLSSDYPPMPEFAQDAALYFDPYQPEVLATALSKVLEDLELQRSLGEKAKKVASQYTIGKSVAETWKSILNVLK